MYAFIFFIKDIFRNSFCRSVINTIEKYLLTHVSHLESNKKRFFFKKNTWFEYVKLNHETLKITKFLDVISWQFVTNIADLWNFWLTFRTNHEHLNKLSEKTSRKTTVAPFRNKVTRDILKNLNLLPKSV